MFEMKNINRIFSLIIALVLVFSLVACSKKDTGNDKKDPLNPSEDSGSTEFPWIDLPTN